MTILEVLYSVAEQINSGALGPTSRVTASVSGRVADADPNGRYSSSKTKALPESLLDSFRQFRGDTDSTYFGLGDAVDAAVVELAGRVTQGRIYKAASIETEYSIAEVRVLHETARATPQSLRDEFSVYPLVHQHYRAVRYLEPDKQRYYLNWALESADDFNARVAPASIVAKKIRKDLGIEPPPPTWAELQSRAVRALENLRDMAEGKSHDALNAIIERVEGMQA